VEEDWRVQKRSQVRRHSKEHAKVCSCEKRSATMEKRKIEESTRRAWWRGKEKEKRGDLAGGVCAKQKGNKTGKAPRVEGSENLPAEWMRGLRGCKDWWGKPSPKQPGQEGWIASGRSGRLPT
jgi:hypothetical protein